MTAGRLNAVCRGWARAGEGAASRVLASVKSSRPIDAVVMASAALRGDVVYTSDVGDLEKLRRHFPGVRVLAV